MTQKKEMIAGFVSCHFDKLSDRSAKNLKPEPVPCHFDKLSDRILHQKPKA